MPDIDPDSIITIRWSSLTISPVVLTITSYAHAEDLASNLMAQTVLHGTGWKVEYGGPHLKLTVPDIRTKAFKDFAKYLHEDFGYEPAVVLLHPPR